MVAYNILVGFGQLPSNKDIEKLIMEDTREELVINKIFNGVNNFNVLLKIKDMYFLENHIIKKTFDENLMFKNWRVVRNVKKIKDGDILCIKHCDMTHGEYQVRKNPEKDNNHLYCKRVYIQKDDFGNRIKDSSGKYIFKEYDKEGFTIDILCIFPEVEVLE